MDFFVENKEDRAPFQIPLTERCEEKLKEKGVTLPEFLKQTTQKEEKETPIEKENARNHYDKEDLISFHQLFIQKPLTKAA